MWIQGTGQVAAVSVFVLAHRRGLHFEMTVRSVKGLAIGRNWQVGFRFDQGAGFLGAGARPHGSVSEASRAGPAYFPRRRSSCRHSFGLRLLPEVPARRRQPLLALAQSKLPALLSGRKTIISTGTKALQDQLYHRDLPLVGKSIGRPVTRPISDWPEV